MELNQNSINQAIASRLYLKSNNYNVGVIPKFNQPSDRFPTLSNI
ncbi:hypothetical protein [Okeania sp. SIO3I5]|nr:hypothetical protein [Okeania sp. SIO3I5]